MRTHAEGTATMTGSPPVLAVLATGGTIASRRGADGAARPSLSGRDLLALVPPMQVELRPREVLAKDSASLTLADMQAISDAVGAQLADPTIDGVVVLHGTDAMEETALLVQLQHQPAKRVVFTGAQFAADHPQSDGPRNLADALGAAMAPGRGVSLVFGGRALPAWGLYKEASDSPEAFERAAEEEPSLDRALPAPVAGLRVDIVATHPGSDGLHLDASLSAGARGIVISAMGSGNATPELVAAIARARAQGVPVVVSSRVPRGLLAPIYGGGGGGHDMRRAGAIHARILRPGQARILLAALLANGCPEAEIARAFEAGPA
ncbi:asparaginase domain-containing protein [Paracoccus aminovorans]|uniref:asparaginase domain-containing protein n=1 Tax=Paracoccus aminovorans TaxID=34004 RepID=UPI0009EA37EB|nr:asparaginase domain-containing protein [Paracoccus aminovorans]MDQ7777969.1 asparaginase domain-containing protein [Paracoccus aminovorans]